MSWVHLGDDDDDYDGGGGGGGGDDNEERFNMNEMESYR